MEILNRENAKIYGIIDFILLIFLLSFVIAILFYSMTNNSSAASDGPRAPTISANNSSIGTEPWINTGNIFVSDNARASATLVRDELSNYITATGFDFSAIPDGAIIAGIFVEIEKSEGRLSSRSGIRDNEIRIIQGGAIAGANNADASTFWPAPASEGFSSYGGPLDLWGLSWASSQIKASDFGVAISAVNRRISGSGGNESARIDFVRVTVYYELAALGVEQMSYRWRNDDGEEAAVVQSAGFINPNGDFSINWNVVIPGPSHFQSIDEGGTPNTSDYIGASNRTIDEFDMETIASGGPYSRIDVHTHDLATGNDDLGINLVINGVVQTEQIVSAAQSYAWHVVSFSGLSLSDADLSTLRVRLRHVKAGSTDSVRVATMRAEVFEDVTAATFKAAENTLVTGQRKNENARIRFLIRNLDSFVTGSRNYRLEFAPMAGASCQGGDESFSAVPTNASCGLSAACMATTAYFADQDLSLNITPGLTDPSGTFQSGKLAEDPSNEALSIALGGNAFSELEYNIYFTDNSVSGQDYCFRVTNSGAPLDVYTEIARIRIATGYAVSGTYISSAFNSGSPSIFNVIEWIWSRSDISCALCDVRMQIQTASDAGGVPGAWSATWSGPEGDDGDETDFFTVSTGEIINTDHNGDQWIRYRAMLDGDGVNTPIFEQVRIYYQ